MYRITWTNGAPSTETLNLISPTDECDLFIGVGDKNYRGFSVHSSVIGSFSSVLNKMVRRHERDILTNAQIKLVLPDIDPDVFGLLLNYMYRGDITVPKSLYADFSDLVRTYRVKGFNSGEVMAHIVRRSVSDKNHHNYRVEPFKGAFMNDALNVPIKIEKDPEVIRPAASDQKAGGSTAGAAVAAGTPLRIPRPTDQMLSKIKIEKPPALAISGVVKSDNEMCTSRTATAAIAAATATMAAVAAIKKPMDVTMIFDDNRGGGGGGRGGGGGYVNDGNGGKVGKVVGNQRAGDDNRSGNRGGNRAPGNVKEIVVDDGGGGGGGDAAALNKKIKRERSSYMWEKQTVNNKDEKKYSIGKSVGAAAGTSAPAAAAATTTPLTSTPRKRLMSVIGQTPTQRASKSKSSLSSSSSSSSTIKGTTKTPLKIPSKGATKAAVLAAAASLASKTGSVAGKATKRVRIPPSQMEPAFLYDSPLSSVNNVQNKSRIGQSAGGFNSIMTTIHPTALSRIKTNTYKVNNSKSTITLGDINAATAASASAASGSAASGSTTAAAAAAAAAVADNMTIKPIPRLSMTNVDGPTQRIFDTSKYIIPSNTKVKCGINSGMGPSAGPEADKRRKIDKATLPFNQSIKLEFQSINESIKKNERN